MGHCTEAPRNSRFPVCGEEATECEWLPPMRKATLQGLLQQQPFQGALASLGSPPTPQPPLRHSFHINKNHPASFHDLSSRDGTHA